MNAIKGSPQSANWNSYILRTKWYCPNASLLQVLALGSGKDLIRHDNIIRKATAENFWKIYKRQRECAAMLHEIAANVRQTVQQSCIEDAAKLHWYMQRSCIEDAISMHFMPSPELIIFSQPPVPFGYVLGG